MKTFSLQTKIKQLEELENYFQKPDLDLEEAITKHQEALVLAAEIMTYLDKAETTIEEIDRQHLLSKQDDQVILG